MKIDRSTPATLIPRSSWDGYSSAPSGAGDNLPLLDFGFVFKVIRRRIKLITGFILLALLVAAIIAATATPYYNAIARLIVERPSIDVLQQESVMLEQALNPAEADGLLQVIASDKLIGSTIDSLGLLSDPAFMRVEANPVSVVRGWLIDRLRSLRFLDSVLPPQRDQQAEVGQSGRQAAIRSIQDRLVVRRVGLSYVFVIDVTWTSPDLAAKIANGLADAFIADRLAVRIDEATAATTWLDGRLADLRRQVEDADAAVARFRAEANIVDAGREGLLNEQQLAALSTQLSNATTETRDREDQARRFRAITVDNLLTSALGASPDEQSLAELRTELVGLQEKQRNAAERFGATHAVTVDLDEQVSRLTERIGAQITRVSAGLDAAYDEAANREASLRAQVDQLSAQSSEVGSAQIKLKGLESEAAVYRSLYDGYLQRYTQTIQQLSFPSADARVITPATPPDYDTFSGATVGVLALAIGASLGIAAALLRERMDRTIRTPWQLRLATGVPTLGFLPAASTLVTQNTLPVLVTQTLKRGSKVQQIEPVLITAPPCRLVISDPLSRFTETIRRVKIAVDNSPHNAPCQIVGFISSEPTTARSVVAANYAQLIAMSGHKTLLLDLDMRDPTLSQMIAPTAGLGLADFAEPGRVANIETATYLDPTSLLKFLPARGLEKAKAPAQSYISAERLPRILTQLSASHECIVIDMPPLSVSSDAVSLAAMITGFIVVSEWGKTSGDSLARNLSESGIRYDKLLGSVLGEVNLTKYRAYENVD